MGKIIKQSVEEIVVNKQKFALWMKWKFKIEFANDIFWPYEFKFEKDDCYFNDAFEDRGSFMFPLKNKEFNNTEIFLENDDIIITVWKRESLQWESKNFIDIINIKTEKKYRLFTDEVNLIFNSEDKIIINAEENGIFKTFVLDIKSLDEIEKKEEKLLAFFKSIYNCNTKEWFVLDFSPKIVRDYKEEDFRDWSYILQLVDMEWEPKSFDRKKFKIKTDWKMYDIWEESII